MSLVRPLQFFRQSHDADKWFGRTGPPIYGRSSYVAHNQRFAFRREVHDQGQIGWHISMIRGLSIAPSNHWERVAFINSGIGNVRFDRLRDAADALEVVLSTAEMS